VLRFLSSPRLALALLGTTAGYAVVGAFASGLFGDHRPFSSPLFIALIAGVFLSTFACTWRRSIAVWRILGGRPPASAISIAADDRRVVLDFLDGAGFRLNGDRLWRWRPALLAGWLLHVALLVLIAGVAVQLAFYDRGLFEVAEGEMADLRASGIVFGRQSGFLADVAPPALEVAVLEFDPYRHQRGYAPDRFSSLLVRDRGSERRLVVDRAKGARVGGVRLYQSLVTGVAVVFDSTDRTRRAVHLAAIDERLGRADLLDGNGRPFSLEVESTEPLNGPKGTGPVQIRGRWPDRTVDLELGDVVELVAGERATIASVVRWSGFSYAVSPGMPAVVIGFCLVLAASLLLVFPAGLGRLEERDGVVTAIVWSIRGLEVLAQDWENGPQAPIDHSVKEGES